MTHKEHQLNAGRRTLTSKKGQETLDILGRIKEKKREREKRNQDGTSVPEREL